MIRFPDAPDRIKALPRDHRGFPVPWFVAFVDGKPDFRVVEVGKIGAAIKRNRCWICGNPMGLFKAFVIGPMCAINRISAEPPMHRQCAVFSAKHCPFLIQPRMRRNEKELPDHQLPPGHMITRNPGVALVWVTQSWERVSDRQGGFLFQVGEPVETLWFAEGRSASRAEVIASIESGLPLLAEPAKEEGAEAVMALAQMLASALTLIPSEHAVPA